MSIQEGSFKHMSNGDLHNLYLEEPGVTASSPASFIPPFAATASLFTLALFLSSEGELSWGEVLGFSGSLTMTHPGKLQLEVQAEQPSVTSPVFVTVQIRPKVITRRHVYLFIRDRQNTTVGAVSIIRPHLNERLLLLLFTRPPQGLSNHPSRWHVMRPILPIPMLNDPHMHSDLFEKTRHTVVFAVRLEAGIVLVYRGVEPGEVAEDAKGSDRSATCQYP